VRRDIVVILVAVAAVTLVSLVPPGANLPGGWVLALRALAAVALSVIVVVFFDLVRRTPLKR
jgi:hypothetical protein